LNIAAKVATRHAPARQNTRTLMRAAAAAAKPPRKRNSQ
jgi:hypothetical protein